MRFLIFLILFPTTMFCQENILINVYNRDQISLNGQWNYIVDPYENGFYNYRYEPFENSENPPKGAFFLNSKPDNKSDLVEYDFDKSEIITVPGDWNTQSERLYYYEGTVWYKKSFNYQKAKELNRVFVYFDAINYQADVYFNGKKLGKHVGGFTPFNFEVTKLLKAKDNFLVVKVDNKRKKEAIPTLNTDWWNYGGITRDVKLVEVPENFIYDYFIQLDPENDKKIKGYIKLSGEEISKKKIRIIIPELAINNEVVTDVKGMAKVTIDIAKIKLWEPQNPYLYDVIIEAKAESIKDQIGFRTIKTRGQDILLNNEEVFLKGICIHEESAIRKGRAHTKEDAKQLLTWAKELGCNYVRLAHYPHNEHMVRLADKMGIMVWEENPVYWTIEWENKETYKNAENQLTEVINRDKNRASVIIWSMANETPTNSSRNLFLTNLAKKSRSLDPTRLISAALEQSDYEGNNTIKTIDDPFAEVVDVLSFNQYIGWYDGLPEKCRNISWKITQNKPVLVSEFGAGAKFGLHADELTRWSEEYQAYLYQETLKMLSRVEQLRGFSPWILVDFRSPRRVLPEIQEGYNRKGLISEKGEKKKAFNILRNFYDQKKK
ncbi:glycoside hydrolase family 2 TIM barrel-domain containing protein [uncultured Aquimarina sp.]|uniref:glycoside hydrolase family 2 protein n=1 Tax=uncultured Aquimarina sp. TaxID=575652 RepID=UPI00262F4438|nr:glycoside hydrolase family 2 TIM barrel-domain containing protein [uncultured Aquimarina sp.]